MAIEDFGALLGATGGALGVNRELTRRAMLDEMERRRGAQAMRLAEAAESRAARGFSLEADPDYQRRIARGRALGAQEGGTPTGETIKSQAALALALGVTEEELRRAMYEPDGSATKAAALEMQADILGAVGRIGAPYILPAAVPSMFEGAGVRGGGAVAAGFGEAQEISRDALRRQVEAEQQAYQIRGAEAERAAERDPILMGILRAQRDEAVGAGAVGGLRGQAVANYREARARALAASDGSAEESQALQEMDAAREMLVSAGVLAPRSASRARRK